MLPRSPAFLCDEPVRILVKGIDDLAWLETPLAGIQGLQSNSIGDPKWKN